MVFSRNGSKKEYEELIKLAEEGISDEELESVLAEYEEEQEQISAEQQFKMKREAYKKQKAQEGLESGAGGFKRSS